MDAQRKPPAMLFVLIVSALATLIAPAGAAPGAGARAQLIEGGAAAAGRFAGLRIQLPADAITYWRDPGDAGVAPSFDFSKSENLGSAEVLFPAPARFDEAGAQIIGYRREVVLPLRVTARDPSRPIALAVAVDYALCANICIPARADLRLDLPPQAEAAPGFAAAMARVPRRVAAEEAAALARLSRAPDRDGKPQWLLRLTTPAPDVFAEPPAGFHVESRKTPEGFLLTLDERPAPDALPPALRITVAGEAPFEFSQELK